MKQVRDWHIQTTWWVSGIFATGAAWYFLSKNSLIGAGVSGFIALVIACAAIWLHTRKDRQGQEVPESVPPDTAEDFSRRYLEEPSHIRFIKYLPRARRLARDEAQEGWDTGVTLQMREASHHYIDFLESSWLRLAEFYPPNHFGAQNPKQFITDYIQRQANYHWAKHEPRGPGTGGTIVGVIAAADVISDLERLIEDLVTSLFGYDEEFDTDQWVADWRSDTSGDA